MHAQKCLPQRWLADAVTRRPSHGPPGACAAERDDHTQRFDGFGRTPIVYPSYEPQLHKFRAEFKPVRLAWNLRPKRLDGQMRTPENSCQQS